MIGRLAAGKPHGCSLTVARPIMSGTLPMIEGVAMRVVGAVLLCLVACAPAVAQAQKPAKAPTAVPAAPASAAYAGMPPAERMAIQNDLIWVGAYNGTATGEFGPRAVAAVKAFQKDNGGRETGVLLPVERTALAAAARTKQEAVGWNVLGDQPTGMRLGLPLRLLGLAGPIKDGSRYRSPRNDVQIETFKVAAPGIMLAAVFEQQKKEPAGRQVDYSVLRPDFFVVSGLQGQKKFYVRAEMKSGEMRGFTVLYDQALDKTMEPVVVAMSSTFMAFPTGALAVPPPPPKTEYSTGIILDAAGHILAARDTTSGCYVITTGLGPADRIADDKDTGLALLRVYGASDPHAIAFANGAPPSPDITLVGIADPQVQGGGDAVSAVRARLGDGAGTATRPIAPAPVLGFSGAAALDAQGHLVGMVSLKPALVAGPPPAAAPAALVARELIERFLGRENVAPAASSGAGLDAAKAAVVRIICSRK